MRLASLGTLLIGIGGCGDSIAIRRGVLDLGGISDEPPDLSIEFGDDAGKWSGPCDEVVHPCDPGQRCFESQCIPDQGTCVSDNECQNDTWCHCRGGGGGDAGACIEGVCIAWGLGPRGLFDPDCSTPGFTPMQFAAPKLKCSWKGSGVMSSVFVADLDGDHRPELIAQTMNSTLVALHGKDCALMWEKPIQFSSYNAHVAIADLDGDKKPEIIGLGSGQKVMVLDNNGNLLATSPMAFPGSVSFGAPSIADVDGQAPPEIIAPHQVLRYTKGNPMLTVVWSGPSPGALADGLLPLVADFDGDNKPEVVQGKMIQDGRTGADETPPRLKALAGPGSFSAVGDFNNDKKPDLVLVQNFNGPVSVSVWDVAHDVSLFGPYPFNGQRMGPPTVADFDGDGRPEFATAGADAYRVYSLKCVPMKAGCAAEGVLWEKVTQDKSSGVTGSSVFDFNGDRRAEVVYRDECWLRVYNGPNGKTLFATSVTSFTALELPVIADVDNDGHADIVVSADSSMKTCPGGPEAETMAPFGGYEQGIFVYQDPLNRWMPSRAVWNQHSYHITNVNDDLTIPLVEKNNWLTLNNYRQNVQGTGDRPLAIADVTSGAPIGIDQGQVDCMTAWTLRANLCNRGSAELAAGTPGTFYDGDPARGKRRGPLHRHHVEAAAARRVRAGLL